MKKIIAVILLVAMLAMALCACGGKTGTCDLCGTENVAIECITVQGEDGWFCDDCYETAEGLAELAEMFG